MERESRHLVVGTAGHIDHGKTALVQALTGKNTDRLKEEQERGISIDIDFAPLRYADGTLVGLVDVPGHERFVRNMVAGAAGINAALLAVDVNEGMMPQTLEHLAILGLLGVESGIVALTKVDGVDPEWVELAKDVVREGLAGSVLKDAPVLAVSSRTGEGIDALKEALHQLAHAAPRPNTEGAFRLPVDKVFSVPGFGTVVSGTVWRGQVRVGDDLVLLPGGVPVRVRGVQSHGAAVDEIGAGRRAALNLSGVSHTDVQRGCVVATPGSLTETGLLDVHLEALQQGRGIFHRDRVHVHLGTAETVGRVLLLEADELALGEQGYAQLVLERPLVCQAGDHLVIRQFSPVVTVGGGHVVDASPARLLRRKREDVVANLAAREGMDPLGRLAGLAQAEGLVTIASAAAALGLTAGQAESILSQAEAAEGPQHIMRLPGGWTTAAQVQAQLDLCADALSVLHRKHRLLAWVARTDLLASLASGWKQRDEAWLLDAGEARGLWIQRGAKVKAADWQVRLSDEETGELERLSSHLLAAGLAGVETEEITALLPNRDRVARALLDHGTERGLFHRVAADHWLHGTVVAEALGVLAQVSEPNPWFALAQARDAWGTSRKVAVMLLEYLDRLGITERRGDERRYHRDRAEKWAAVTDF